jgi:hypothetical protein
VLGVCVMITPALPIYRDRTLARENIPPLVQRGLICGFLSRPSTDRHRGQASFLPNVSLSSALSLLEMSAIYSSILLKVQKLKAEEPVARVSRQHISPQPSGLGMTLAWHDTPPCHVLPVERPVLFDTLIPLHTMRTWRSPGGPHGSH